MKIKFAKRIIAGMLAATMLVGLTGCGGNRVALNNGEVQEVDASELAFPLAEQKTLTGLTSFPAGSEAEPNNRTIFKRLEEQTNVHIEWQAIQSDQWQD